MTDHHVYYCYGSDGQLLYVGCSKYPRRRIWTHNWSHNRKDER